ncbi:hypothetical protein MBLNU457_5331t1 [Dothideomycetes sp. NU457]
MAAVLPRPAPVSQRSSSPQPPLSINTSTRGSPAAVPNKHLPTCSPGPRPHSRQFDSPTSSPSPAPPKVVSDNSSLLYPPDQYTRVSTRFPIYSLSGPQLHAALDHIASQPLPDPKLVFPWMHGLHPDNNLQLAFFIARRRSLKKLPRCIRGITIVKARGDLSHSKLKGAVAPDELLHIGRSGLDSPRFLESDPKEGFSVRNFQIQAAKLATMSDVVVYGDDKTPKEEVRRLAESIAKAQKVWKEKDREAGVEKPSFSTFILQEPYHKMETDHREIVAVDSQGLLSGHVIDFFNAERREMQSMSAASEIAPNVFMGPTPDASMMLPPPPSNGAGDPTSQYDLLIEATDIATMPDAKAFSILEDMLNDTERPKNTIPQLEFPGSGSILPPTWSQTEVDSLMRICTWIYNQANGISGEAQAVCGANDTTRKRKDSKLTQSPIERDTDGDSIMGSTDHAASAPIEESDASSGKGRKILMHCADGYTETTLLAVAYYMFVNCVPLHQAYIELHTKHKRNFFAYPTDIALLSTIQPRIMQSSPVWNSSFDLLTAPPPAWMSKIDGSLPSRISDYMYLGNLAHANNPGLLKELGIGQVLSVGEQVSWSEQDLETFAGIASDDKDVSDRLMYIDKVQDNGVDPLTEEFPRCLEFIEKGRKAGTATLVHCRVGVSRSATICIAEMMNEHGFSFPQAYCYVRARRLNVIIQPHLRFAYELLKYEEYQAQKRGIPFKRELEWATIAREIAAMNKPYSRQ